MLKNSYLIGSCWTHT